MSENVETIQFNVRKLKNKRYMLGERESGDFVFVSKRLDEDRKVVRDIVQLSPTAAAYLMQMLMDTAADKLNDVGIFRIGT